MGLGHSGEAVRGHVASHVGPHHGAGLPQRAPPHDTRRRLAPGQPRHLPAVVVGQQHGAAAGVGVARAGRAARARLPPAARAAHLHGCERRVGRLVGAAAGHAAALGGAPLQPGAGRPRAQRAPVGRRRRDAAGRHRHRHGGRGDVAVARALAGGVRVRGRRGARVGRAGAARRAVRAARPQRARARRRAPPRPPRHRHGMHGRHGAHLRHAQGVRRGGGGARGRPARRARRAPPGAAARLRVGEPVHQHLRPARRTPQHDQVPRGLHGRAHRARLLPHLPPAQVRDGRGLEGLDGVGVRVGGAAVTLAVRAGAAAALLALTPPAHRPPPRHAPHARPATPSPRHAFAPPRARSEDAMRKLTYQKKPSVREWSKIITSTINT